MRPKKEIKYTDMTEIELQFIINALKHRNMELEAETKRLHGQLAQAKVTKFYGVK